LAINEDDQQLLFITLNCLPSGSIAMIMNQSGLALASTSCIHVLGCQNKHEMSNVG
jgi:hypothetical protein